MAYSKTPAASMKSLLLRPAQTVALVFAVTLTLALGALALSTWFDLKRVETIRARENRTYLLQESETLIEEEQLRLANGAAAPLQTNLDKVRSLLGQLPARGGPIGPFTREKMEELDRLLAQSQSQPVTALAGAQSLLNRMLQRENEVQSELLDSVRRDTLLEWRLALAALVVFPCLVVLALWALRERVFRPIDDLRAFLSRLAEGQFVPVSLPGIDPLLRPLFENYNQMVTRLEQLEQANRRRTSSLEEEVRAATQTLLRQQQTLMRTERLAAAGEVSASLAHELRNPIAGMLVTLANLRKELGEPELGERIDLVISELQRMTRLLNGLLQQSSHVPEPRREVAVDHLIQEVATLLRYQVPAQVQLLTAVRPGLRCRLPEDGLRQAVVNLVSNSAEALSDSAGTISIGAERDGARMRLQISDDGPGFPQELVSGGIRPFASFRDNGTGLGLAIVKRFASDLGGELRIANREPHGAVATLTFPCDDRDAAADRG